MTIRVFLVDDQHLVRAGFAMLIGSQDDMQVVGEAPDGAAALEALTNTRADVVLMDIRMPGIDGVETTLRLSQRAHRPKVLLLTTFDLDEYLVSGLRAGASGFLLKDTEPEFLLGAIRQIHDGESVVAPTATRRLIETFVLPAEPAGANYPDRRRLDQLTERELDVLVLIAQGLSNTEIREKLVVAEATVKTHVSHILAKTGARDRVQLVVLGYETGLITPGDHTQV